MACQDGRLATAEWREPTSSDRLPSIGVSLQPAIPRRVAPRQSPLPLHQSPTIVAQIQSREPIKLRCSTSLRDAGKLALLGQTGMSSLLCTPGDISILRRQLLCGKPNRMTLGIGFSKPPPASDFAWKETFRHKPSADDRRSAVLGRMPWESRATAFGPDSTEIVRPPSGSTAGRPKIYWLARSSACIAGIFSAQGPGG
jgi:hypothetical protein